MSDVENTASWRFELVKRLEPLEHIVEVSAACKGGLLRELSAEKEKGDKLKSRLFSVESICRDLLESFPLVDAVIVLTEEGRRDLVGAVRDIRLISGLDLRYAYALARTARYGAEERICLKVPKAVIDCSWRLNHINIELATK